MASIDDIRKAAESDLELFIKLIAPHRVLGHVHTDLIRWWTRKDAKSHQLCLLPRDHGKSAMMAYRVAWEVTKDPTIRILYISSTANLAEKQLKMIKDILDSRAYRRYWPEMLNPEEGKREKWTQTEIAVDHPLRQEEGIRDPTIFTGGLTTSLTGLHCDIAVMDDVVVQENAYTEEGREKVESQYSLLSSIEGADAREWVVGTRYHPKDLYSKLSEMEMETYDKEGNVIETVEVYEIYSKQVESVGDGSGEFLWPRQQRNDGKWFGFDANILSKKKAQYLDKTQFYAQYYNDPNRYENSLISQEDFQYYERSLVINKMGKWFVRGNPVSVFAACDIAYTTKKEADYTAIVVVGVDSHGYIYVLDIDRFKTDKISVMYEHIKDLHVKWGFRKIRMEMTAAQSVVVKEMKDSYLRPAGLSLSIDEHHPTAKLGAKEERMFAVLQPRYANKSVWHYRGGNCQSLEEELKSRHPQHDDIMDALSQAIEISVAPVGMSRSRGETTLNVHPRFGGIALGG
jgi:phage terminase large subunit-like protein